MTENDTDRPLSGDLLRLMAKQPTMQDILARKRGDAYAAHREVVDALHHPPDSSSPARNRNSQ